MDETFLKSNSYLQFYEVFVKHPQNDFCMTVCIEKSKKKSERNNATLKLNSPHYCTIILVNYEKFFPSIFGYLVLTYLSSFWNFLNIALVSEFLMSDHTRLYRSFKKKKKSLVNTCILHKVLTWKSTF